MVSIYDSEIKVNKKGTKKVPFGQTAGLEAVLDASSDAVTVQAFHTVLTVLACGI